MTERTRKNFRFTAPAMENLNYITEVMGLDETSAITIALSEYARYLRSNKTVHDSPIPSPPDRIQLDGRNG